MVKISSYIKKETVIYTQTHNDAHTLTLTQIETQTLKHRHKINAQIT